MKESLFQKFEYKKAEAFKANQDLNLLIMELAHFLKPIQKKIESGINKLDYPVFIIVGNPRSGTTLLTQWIGSLSFIEYPSNFLTRFAYAPYIGALIQEMIFNPKYDFHEDFSDIQSKLNFSSYLAKSKGALATNEFQHFFRNYMNNFDPEYLTESELKKVNVTGIMQGLASIQKVFCKSFVTKGFMLQYNLSHFMKNIPNLVPIFVYRDPLENMQSIFSARQAYYGDETIWLGGKPKEYDKLKEMDIYHQIAGQVYYTNKTIEDSLREFKNKNYIKVRYEKFCNNPEILFNKLKQVCTEHFQIANDIYEGPTNFTVHKTKDVGEEIKKNLVKAYKKISIKL